MEQSLQESIENGEAKFLEFRLICDDYHYYLHGRSNRLLAKVSRNSHKIVYSAMTSSKRIRQVIDTFINATITQV